jgi:hypothetical protein
MLTTVVPEPAAWDGGLRTRFNARHIVRGYLTDAFLNDPTHRPTRTTRRPGTAGTSCASGSARATAATSAASRAPTP